MSYYLLKKGGAVAPVAPTDPFAISILGIDDGPSILTVERDVDQAASVESDVEADIIGIEVVFLNENGELVTVAPLQATSGGAIPVAGQQL